MKKHLHRVAAHCRSFAHNANFELIALIGLAALSLSACDKRPPTPPAPQVVSPVATESVPAAEDVFSSPATTTKPDPTAGRSNNAMSRTQESTAMPMPGQNNDHSAALTPPKATASDPARR